MTDNAAALMSISERKMLDGILDQIIPASADGLVPSAGALGIAGFIVAKVAADADLQTLFRNGVSAASALVKTTGHAFDALSADQIYGIVKHLEERQPAFFQVLIRDTYMGYYSRADIRPLFGLSANPTQPDGYAVPEEDPEDMAALVEPVKNRGVCFREC